MNLEYPTSLAQWAPIPKRSHELSPKEVKGWAYAIGLDVAHIRGEEQPSIDIVKGLLELYPAPETVDRCLFLSSVGTSYALVDFSCAEEKNGWQDKLIEKWSEGPEPMRPVENDAIEMPPLEDAFRFIRLIRQEAQVNILMSFAGVFDGTVITATTWCQDPPTVAELAQAMPLFLSGVSVVKGS